MKKDWGLNLAVLLLLLGLISIFIPYFKLNGLSILDYRIEIGNYNELGDFIGGVTAPFLSISAFILLYLTYKSQKNELKESRVILDQQNKTLFTQQFETTFFNLVNLHHQITNNISFSRTISQTDGDDNEKESSKNENIKLMGRDCFRQYYEEFKKIYKRYSEEKKTTFESKTMFNSQLERYLIETAYADLFDDYQSYIGHYFRNLYHILKFVDQSKVSDKKLYAGLIRAQLSTFELVLLFYNCLSSYGNKFRPLVEKYHLLKNYDINKLTEMEQHTLYSNSAFGK